MLMVSRSGCILIEDYTQHEVNEISEQFKQRSGETLFSWMVCLHDQGTSCDFVFIDNATEDTSIYTPIFVPVTLLQLQDF